MKYIYIFEDGTIQQSDSKPTDADIDCIADGILSVVVFDGKTALEVDSDGQRYEVETCKQDGDFHVPS